jgi:hypothetical protein
MTFLYLLLLCLLTISFFENCGRKQKNIFSFEDTNKKNINILTLPCVKGLTVKKTSTGQKISWKPLQKTKNILTGYNIYRFTNKYIIPKKPIYKSPKNKNSFIDSEVSNNLSRKIFYIVKPVFLINNKQLEGPASIIVKYKK